MAHHGPGMTRRSTASAYVLAVLIVTVAAAVRFSLVAILDDDSPYMPFVVSVMVAASYGGLKPGLLATILSALAGVYLFVPPYFSFRVESPSEAVAVSLFVIAGVTISWLCEALYRAQRRLEDKRFRLEEEVAEREKAEAAARESEARLREADRHKDEFLAMLAHELRNPLAPIRNAVNVLRLHGPKAPELQWGRDVIERQVECLTRLIDDLLDVSRISRGKMELRKRLVELAEIVRGAVESSRPVIEQHRHELIVTLPPEPIFVDADVVRLAQVFMNLLNNAAKYTEPGGHIWLTAEPRGASIVVSVKDTGIGIARDKLPHVFEIFYQVDQALERSEGGLGIGLTLVRRLVEMHGGTVEVRSDGPGTGSQFCVTLPIVEGTLASAGQELADNDERLSTLACRVLVVDDNTDSAESLAMLLRLSGKEVQTARDGVEGVAAVERFRPDVVLLDVGMPRLNGVDACRRIRQLDWGRELTIIALTGWASEEGRRRTREAGFDYHLVKPVKLDDLVSVLAAPRPTAARNKGSR